MMMSAPARRMPVSASIMAASSSSQPSCPAARSMAYSPETEYAATGRPNSFLTRAITSRYGRGGSPLPMCGPSCTAPATPAAPPSHLVQVARDLAHRPHGVGGTRLVRAAFTDRGRLVRRPAEGAVERRGVLGRVGHDRRLLIAALVESLADGRHSPIHHVGGGHHV